MNSPLKAHALAAVFHRPGEPLELREFQRPVVQSGEALVEITCSTICGSDLHTIRGDRPVAGPTVLGHEIIGRIAELPASGPQVCDVSGTPLEIGDRVTWSVAASCGACFFCGQGLAQKCEKLLKYGHETTDRRALSGGLAEFCHLAPGTAIVNVPDELSDFVACPANCATATVAAAFRTAGGSAGKSVVIHGAGMLGLTAAAMAASQGASCVIATDISDERLARATIFGATHAISVANGTQELGATLDELTEKRGADLIFELSGSTSVVEESIEQLRIAGQLVLVGSVFPSRAAQLAPEQIVRKLLRIEGVHNYAPADLSAAVEFLKHAAGQFPFESLVDAEFSLQNANVAIERAMASRAIRLAVRPR
jgi:alcohol dehydrogenase